MYPYTMDIIVVPTVVIICYTISSTRLPLSRSQFNSIVHLLPYLFLCQMLIIIHVIGHVSSLTKYLYLKEWRFSHTMIMLIRWKFNTEQLKTTQTNTSLLHLMRAIARAHASTRVNSLMRVKNCKCHLCLWHLLSGILEQIKWKREHQLEWLIFFFFKPLLTFR